MTVNKTSLYASVFLILLNNLLSVSWVKFTSKDLAKVLLDILSWIWCVHNQFQSKNKVNESMSTLPYVVEQPFYLLLTNHQKTDRMLRLAGVIDNTPIAMFRNQKVNTIPYPTCSRSYQTLHDRISDKSRPRHSTPFIAAKYVHYC